MIEPIDVFVGLGFMILGGLIGFVIVNPVKSQRINESLSFRLRTFSPKFYLFNAVLYFFVLLPMFFWAHPDWGFVFLVPSYLGAALVIAIRWPPKYSRVEGWPFERF